MRPDKERRRNTREMCSDFVQLAWTGDRGEQVVEVGVLEDVSREGMCVSVDTPVPVHSTVRVHTRGLDGAAEVRYCDRNETGYQVGLEFLDGCTWDREKWRPRHLLDEELVRALEERSRL